MKFIPNTISRSFHRQMLIGRKHSPHILFGAGVIGVIGSTVLACRATLKLGDQLDHFKQDIDDINDRQLQLIGKDENYTDKDRKKDLAYVYVRDSAKIVKLYAPALVVGVASIGALTGSHVTLTRRNSALAATVVGLTNFLDEYRNRVVAEVGQDRERELYSGIMPDEVTDENGKKTKIKKIDPNGVSPYVRIFDEVNPNWQPNAETNLLFIRAVQNYHNELLKARGHVFLNEVYRDLGFEHSSAGAVVGWVISDDGDNYIDFGIFKSTNEPFISGIEPSVWLDFNVDGVIFDKIGR